MRSHRERRLGHAALWVCAGLALGAGGEGESVSFRFAPPDTDCTQTLTVTVTKDFAGLGSQVDRWESVTELAFRRSGDGYSVTATPVSLEATRDGAPVSDPVRDLLQDIVIRYRIGADGRIESVEGFEGLVGKIQAAFPSELAAKLVPVLSEEALVAREKEEWDARIGDFAGREFALGDAIEAEEPFVLPNGQPLLYRTRTTIPALEPCAAGSCARVSVRYDSDAAALEALAGEAAEAPAGGAPAGTAAPPAAAPEPGKGSRISGTATRLIDPATMLIQSETGTRKIEMTLEVSGRGAVPTTVTEERSYRFDYR